MVVTDDNLTPGNTSDDFNPSFTGGDTDGDSSLDVNETWTYTSTHTVTQAELDAGTPIVNVATVTGTGAAQDTDDASVAVVQSKILHIEKDATVADGTANSTNDTIAYTYTVTNQGNAAIANVVVTDDNRTPGNTSDDFNPSFTGGDTDKDNLLDVGETWTYTATHTVTQAELDAGTTIVNVATADRHGAAPDTDDASVAVTQSQDPAHREGRDGSGRHGELDQRRHQLHAGGDQPGQRGDSRRGGERSVHDQRGAGLQRHLQCRRHRQRQPARRRRDLAVHGQPSGDAGRAGCRDEHRQHRDGDRHRGDPGHATTPTVPVAQSKTCTSRRTRTVPGGTADVAGETINYTLAVTNQGNAAIAGVVVSDPFTTNEAPVLNDGFNIGDTDQDNLLDVGETWQYTASHQVTQAELDAGTNIVNTATVTGTGATSDTDDATVPVAQSKILHIEKDATVADGTANSTSDMINYTLAVTNQGNAAIAGVVVTERQPWTPGNTSDDF